MHFSERLDGWVRVILIALIGLLPFAFVPVSWVFVTQVKVALVAIALMIAGVLWLIARISDRALKLPWTSALIAAIFVPLVYAISAALTGFQSVSLIGGALESDTLALVALGFSFFALTAVVFTMHPGKILSALRALLFGSLVLLIAEVAHFVFPSLSLGGALAGQTGNLLGTWHEFAMYVGFIGLLSVALLRTPVTTGMWKYVVWSLIPLAGIFLVIANYADVLIAITIAAALLIGLRMYRARIAGSALWGGHTALGIFAGTVLFLAVFGSFIVNVLPDGIRVAQNEVRPSYAGTFAIGQQSLAHPLALLFGAGPNTFNRQWGMYKPLNINQTAFWNLDFPTGAAPVATALVTVGILGLLGWLSFMAAVLWSAIRLWFSSTDTPAVPIALPLSVGVLYLFVMHIASVPGTTLTLLTFGIAGLMIALLTPTFVATKHISLARGGLSHVGFSVAIVSALVMVVAGGSLVRVTVSEALVNRGVVAYNDSENVERASVLMQRALAVYPKNDRAHRSAVQLGLVSLQKLMASSDTNDEAARSRLQTKLEETIQHGLAAVAIDGQSYQNWLLLASLYAQLAGSNVEGAYENARTAFENAVQENPTSPIPYMNLAQLELLQGNAEEALALLAQTVQLKTDYAPAYYLASQIYAGQQSYQAALQAAVNAAQYAQGDSQAWYNLGAIAYNAKQYADADAALRQALVLQPQFANAMFVYALARYQLADATGALVILQELDKLDSNQPLVNELISDLIAGRELTPAQLLGQSKTIPSAAGATAH